MAMVLDSFVSFFIERLGNLVLEEAAMLLGVEEDHETLKRTMQLLKAFLRDAEQKKIDEESIRLWISRLREVMYDADDLIDDYLLEVNKHRQQQDPAAHRRPCLQCSWFSCIRFRHKIGKRIADINGKLELIYRDKPASLQPEKDVRRDDAQAPSGGRRNREMGWMLDENDVVGMDLEAQDLVDRLTHGSSDDKCPIYSIVGLGGIGKTTLARKVYSNGLIDSYFAVKLWVCVSQNFNETEVLNAIIESAGSRDRGGVRTRGGLESEVTKIVENQRFLLVLDDVWDGSIWEECLKCPLQSGAPNSRILVTTRREDVARRMGTSYSHNMELLPQEDGWRLLCNAFRGDTLERVQRDLRDIGMEIVAKCKGLPLAIKAIRGVLLERGTCEDTWREVLRSRFWDYQGLPDGVMRALYLSYEELPRHLKQCFVYCSLFPEDSKLYKVGLVQMWIAEGFVETEGDLATEETGHRYYKELMDRGLLQAAPDTFEDRICRMHDLVRELALHISKHNYIYRGANNPGDATAHIRHLAIVGRGDLSEVPEIYTRNRCLRTVLLSDNPSITSVPHDFFNKLTRLRVLDLSHTAIDSLTNSVGNLVYLRFLDVSYTKLKELPESIHKLQNLQVLGAAGCQSLRRLPQGVVGLLNLTVLSVYDSRLDQMPTGIGQLKKLRTLADFVVNDESQGGNNLKELQNLTQLRELSMYKLEAVASKAEAEAAMLKNKSNLSFLILSCAPKTDHRQLEDREIQKIEEVFEGLVPPSKLGVLRIKGFFGRQFPSWITSLGDLKRLRLEDCNLCRQLPCGNFSQLRLLEVSSVESVTSVGPEFFSGSARGAPSFPLLEEVYFQGMSNWESWSRLEQGALPVLKLLYIGKCPKLRSLPEGLHHATSWRELQIGYAGELRAINNLPSVRKLVISNNQKLSVLSDLPELKTMEVFDCPSINQTENLTSLGRLRLFDKGMHILPAWLASITSLQRLDLTCSVDLLKRCSPGGEDWHLLRPIPRVEATSGDGSRYISYVRSPYSFKTNLIENGDVAAVAPLASHGT